MYNFSLTDIVGYLFNHSEMKSLNFDGRRVLSSNGSAPGTDCTACSEHPNGKCSKHKHLETLRILKSPMKKDELGMPRALDSIPSEVELCTSSVPGKLYGVRAVQKIPEGTWIGPYEGKHIRPNDITPEMDTSYMWEIFQDGKLVFYLDASDETQSSWMRYVCCARYKEEQNTSVMQYFGNIYYRVFKDIPPGQEILVWYDDSCPHYLGIPFKMQDIGLSSAVKSSDISAPESQPLNRLIRLTTTGSPPTTSISRPKLFSPSLTTTQQVEYPYQYPLPSVVRQQTVLSGYPTNQFPNGHDVITPSIIGHNSDQRLRKYVSTSPKTSLYEKSYLHSSYKKESADTITTNSIIHNPFISYRAKPYTRDKAYFRDVMKNKLRDTSFEKPKEAYLGDVVLDQTRDAPVDLSKKTLNHLNFKNVEQNGNHEHRMPEKDGYLRHNTLMASTDKTIDKFLSQIEEARNEQQTKKQEVQESKKESNNSKQVELDVPPEICIWKCGQCEKSFAQQQILQLHICSNIPEKPYHCTYCTETFSQPSTLRTHAVIHSGKKPFKCGFCSRLFAGSTTLNNHIRTHTGERPFGCEKCGRAFSQASQLSRHRRTMFECM